MRCNEIERLFRRLKGLRRIFSRFETLNVMFVACINFVVVEACVSVKTLRHYRLHGDDAILGCVNNAP